MRSTGRRSGLVGVASLAVGGGCLGRNQEFVETKLTVDGGVGNVEHCRLSASVMRRLGVEVGQQVRVGDADGGECALFTVVEAGDALAVTGGGEERASIDAGTTVTVAGSPTTPDDAPYGGTFEETTREGGTRLLACAPHGGGIEPGTDEQALGLADRADATAWVCRGTWPDGSAHDRWHVTSTDVHPASFPGLATVADRDCERAVAFHGSTAAGVAVGGGAPRGLRVRVRDAIDAAVPLDVRLATRSKYRGVSEDNFVNWAAGTGIQLEQGERARTEHAGAIADAVADVLGE